MAEFYKSIEGWFDFENIYDLAIRRCGSKAARFVEIGSYKGRSTCYLAERIRETGVNASLDVVDTFAGDSVVGHGDLWPDFAGNLERAGLFSTLTAHRCLSVEGAKAFADQTLDFVYVDAAHDSDSVNRDLAAWWPKVRPGGLMAGHDYPWPEVKDAVDMFARVRGLGRAFRADGNSWMIYKTLPIDAAYCINLARRLDRRRMAIEEFEAAGISAQVAFFDGIDGAVLPHGGPISRGQAGACCSHLAVMRAAREQGHRHVLIFEDDVQLADDFRPKFEAALARCPASYDLCYVGGLCMEEWGNFLYPFDDLLSRAGSVFGAHAYIVNLDCHPILEAELGSLRHVMDNWYAQKLQPRGDCYVLTPYLATQLSCFSDVANAFHANSAHAQYVWR